MLEPSFNILIDLRNQKSICPLIKTTVIIVCLDQYMKPEARLNRNNGLI